MCDNAHRVERPQKIQRVRECEGARGRARTTREGDEGRSPAEDDHVPVEDAYLHFIGIFEDD
jgi:hypothetical protein